MDNEITKYLAWLDSQKEVMRQKTSDFAMINSGTDNVNGLQKMLTVLKQEFSIFESECTEYTLPIHQRINHEGNLVPYPLGKALYLKKRPEAPLQILFGGHMDTVFGVTSLFQNVERIREDLLRGPGVADMKGGLVILLKALEAFEKSPYADKIGWQIFINPDEEIGSPGSSGMLTRIAQQANIGILFEPALYGGELVSFRKGSANYTVVAQGKAAHVGRDAENGCSAINALAGFVTYIESLNHPSIGLNVNVGTFHGGIASNIVPPLATCQVNIRAHDSHQMKEAENQMRAILNEIGNEKGVQLTLYPDNYRPPKPFDTRTFKLFQLLKKCGEQIELNVQFHGSGGVCDGNTLAAEGLVTVDTLGARGGNIHTDEEFIYISSLPERAKFVFLFLIELAKKNPDFFNQSEF